MCHSESHPENNLAAQILTEAQTKINYQVICQFCKQKLSRLLNPVHSNFKPVFNDETNIIPAGLFWIASDLPENINGKVLIHLKDQVHLKDHPNPIRSSGCCGKSGSDGPNRICRCLRAVATEVSDCWTSYYLAFEPGKTKLIIVSK